jgi:spore coat protein CotH
MSICFFLLAVLPILLPTVSALAQTSDDLFDGNVLHEVRLYINPFDWANLQRHYLDDTYYAVELHWTFQGRDLVTPQVAIRSRGLGSRSPVKPSMKIAFNRYESQYTFLGLQNLVLRGNTQDASMMHERVAMALFRRMGLPAPREAHARLFVNDQYLGLYTVVEEIDAVFVQGYFGESAGYLYDYIYNDAFFFEYRGPNSASYSPVPFKPENHFIDPDPASIEAMVRNINQAPDAQFQSVVSEYVDLNAFVREIAAENFVSEQDGIIGDYGLNNFYLYRFANTLRSVVLPWDKSNAFWAPDRHILHNVESNVLSRRAIAVPELFTLYRDTLRMAADAAGGAGGWLEQEIIRVYEQIRQAAYEDKNKICDPGATGWLRPCSDEQFDAEVAYMIQFAQRRAAVVRAQLSALELQILPWN